MICTHVAAQRSDRRLGASYELDRRVESWILAANHTVEINEALSSLARGDVDVKRIARRQRDRSYVSGEVGRTNGLGAWRSD
jgi:hypothetical protein